MDLKNFSKANTTRCIYGFKHSIESWSLSDWMTATCGELGEAANIIKKLNRIRDDISNTKGETEDELREELGKEIADTFCYLDLLATAAGYDLSEIVRDKFNEVSRKRNYPYNLTQAGELVHD